MKHYLLTIYWWHGAERSSGGEDAFEAEDDTKAVMVAHQLFEERIALADQSEISDAEGALVWRNEWPVPATGR